MRPGATKPNHTDSWRLLGGSHPLQSKPLSDQAAVRLAENEPLRHASSPCHFSPVFLFQSSRGPAPHLLIDVSFFAIIHLYTQPLLPPVVPSFVDF